MQNQLGQVEYQIIHAVPGRIRVKIPAFKYDRSYADRLHYLVATVVPEITRMRVSGASESIVFSYRPRSEGREKFLQDIQNQLITCIQQAGNLEITAVLPPVSEPVPVIPAVGPTIPDPVDDGIPDAIVASDNDDSSAPPSSTKVRIESDVVDIFEALGLPILEGYVFDLSQLAIKVEQERKMVHIGFPVVFLLSVLQAELDKFTVENEKTTEEERIHLDLNISSVEDGLLLQGNAIGQFRKRLFTTPLTQQELYTPWVELLAIGQAELITHIVDGTLQVEMKGLEVTGDPGEWQEALIEHAFEYLFKDKVVAKINQVLADYNGKKLQNLFFQSQIGQNLLAKTEKIGLTRDGIDTLLGFFAINARLTTDRLWFSIQF